MSKERTVARVEGVSVGDLVRQRTGAAADRWELALVQRSAAWDEVRMARLLDSLLAGYPIGALLVCRVEHGGSILVQHADGREARPADATVSQLLDGQQRVNALVCLFSDAGGYGRFFIDMTAKRSSDEVVTRRRDKRTVLRYIRWTRDGEFSEDAADGERDRHLDLSRFAAWAVAVADDDVRTLAMRVAAEPVACLEVLHAIDPAFDIPHEGLAPEVMRRTARLLEAWSTRSIPVQHLVLAEPSDVLQVFTRINLEGVRIAGDDVFFAGVKTRWPEAEQTLHRVQGSLPLVSRMGALRVLARLASLQIAEGDMLPLRVDRLNGEPGRRLVRAMEAIAQDGPELPRMTAVATALTGPGGLGHALRLVHPSLFDHVLGWAAVNPRVLDPAWLEAGVADITTFLVGASAYGWPTILRETFGRLAFREALAAGVTGEPFPTRRIVSATRRLSPELRVGQRSVRAGPLDVDVNAHFFLSILQELPFELPEGRMVEWDHIYPQALANRLRWRGADGHERLQNHPLRNRVWRGGNLWALDGIINLKASDEWPSAKLTLLAALPDAERKLPSRWPDEGFLSDTEREDLLVAEQRIKQEDIDAGMRAFDRFVSERSNRMAREIAARFPGVEDFAQDAEVDAWTLEDRPMPPEIVRAELVVAKAPRAPEAPDEAILTPDEIRAAAYEFLREADPERARGVHYYDILHAVQGLGLVADGDAAPRLHGILSNAHALFRSLGSGRFTWTQHAAADHRTWVLRTDRGNRSALWAEIRQGRLRQGWGWADDQDLRELRRVAMSGGTWSEAQQAAARNRRMLADEPNSISVGDTIVVPHQPAENRCVLVRVTGPYDYGSSEGWSDYRHILPVELQTSTAGIGFNDPRISPALRRSLRNPSRMWNIDPLGPDVQALLVADPDTKGASGD